MRTSRASCWGFGIARAWTACGAKSRRPKRSRTSRSGVRCRISPSTRFAGIRTTTPSSHAFGRPRHGRQRTHTMHTPTLVVERARELAAAGRHAEVVEFLGAQKRSELADSPSLALLYGSAQARLGCRDEGLRWLDLALDEARRRDERAGEGQALYARGALEPARRELDEVRAIRGRVPNPVAEAEDLRVAALLSLAEGQAAAAEETLRQVIGRAESHGRPQLLAEATRDLVVVLRRAERQVEAQAAARTAKALFTRLGAKGEVRKLAGQGWDEAFAAELRGSLAPLHVAQQLADAGHYAELLRYLGERSQDELEQSPMLTLLCGIAHGRLGRLDLGQQWAMVAQLRARLLRDRTLEVRALNVCGAIALEGGGISEATYFFTRAQEEALRDNDMATVGRCANNLGIIANMQGDYGRAVGDYTRAIAAYQKAHYEPGIVETQHNLGISYREQGQLDKAMQAADTAVREAGRLGDQRLQAQAIAGRAEIRVAYAEPELAIREAERALAMHRDLGDAVLETEDRRILAAALSIAGKTRDAADMLREVIDRATEHKRPLLVAIAQRDLAHILALEGEVAAAKQLAQAARATFDRLGAKVEIEKLEALLAIPTSGATEPDRSQAGDPPPPLNRDPGTRARGPWPDRRASRRDGRPSSCDRAGRPGGRAC